MKTLKLSLAALAFGLMSFNSVSIVKNATVKMANASSIVWKAETIDLGEIPQGTPKPIEFSFKNTGTKSVLITNVKAACGCTATNYTKTPIKPGETATITATYNAATAGPFSKTVTVSLNENEVPKILTIKGKVVELQ